MMASKGPHEHLDLESNSDEDAHLSNNAIHSLTWKDITATVKGRKSGSARHILQNVSGYVKQGELLAIMGASGSGKTTLLNFLSHRINPSTYECSGNVLVNGQQVPTSQLWSLSSYVEQEDALIGSLTIEETLYFAARLSLSKTITKQQRKRRIELLLSSFGIRDQANTLIGTPIRKGISGGQKRRVSVASQLITAPKILFLDEPTSGLDSTASFEVMSFIQSVARKSNILVIASIHQPSSATFRLFDRLLILSAGQTCYFGPPSHLKSFLDSVDCPLPEETNPAEFILEMTNVDFAKNRTGALRRLKFIQETWSKNHAESLNHEMVLVEEAFHGKLLSDEELPKATFFSVVITLLHRSFIKSYRDVVAYGIRIIMYLGLAIMMGTVWLRLHTSQEYIQPFINAIFFGSAFMSFMAVAYVPAYLEDRATFIKERANGLYGATSFIVSNFLIGLPYLFLISILFSIIAYWLSNFRPNADAFFVWVMWLFLDLVAAESLVVLISSIFPNFVVSLALTAFANGLWMSVGGFLVSPTILNVFWRYVFHYIDYQAYVFQGMMVNEFSHRTFTCASSPGSPSACQCMYQTDLAAQCKISGKGVLDAYGYAEHRTGKWVGILVGIIAVYRLFGWIALMLRKS
ncbi:ABC transporter [Xylona heveae TC161]|uniref:ABC transporter n=1 Tax=Xylona heveae (strain CBS 132557 / TC161) TaxID=1328760 RepID=A0A165A1T1_XYLHT|nr:ABC transporter [Xylona heveae TC161]KZF19835.1 ABC transporter [Xylona heveae TC161]